MAHACVRASMVSAQGFLPGCTWRMGDGHPFAPTRTDGAGESAASRVQQQHNVRVGATAEHLAGAQVCWARGLGTSYHALGPGQFWCVQPWASRLKPTSGHSWLPLDSASDGGAMS